MSERVNTLWGRTIADEIAKAGVETAVLAPGSRSTPLTVAFASHPEIETVSLLDERSAAFFSLGYAKRTGKPAPLICTSGTALANFHPAVIEADAARVPMILLTADRPPELADSGANQTIDQEKIYGSAVRMYRKLPEPEAADRKVQSVRTAISRAVGSATGPNAGPIHFDVPFRKPLEPNVGGDATPNGVPNETVPSAFKTVNRTAVDGRDDPFVKTTRGRSRLSTADRQALAETVINAESGLIVCGPSDRPAPTHDALVPLARATEFPVFVDPLSGHRFGSHTEEIPICGGYDGYLSTVEATPEIVIRFGASPTSKALRNYLRDAEARQLIVDPTGGWREATFTATDLIVADETELSVDLAASVDRGRDPYTETITLTESRYWQFVDGDEPPEGAVLSDVAELAPDPATLFVSNSMPVRDLDRFGRPHTGRLTVLGNRGASGIDGVTSTALGAGHGTDDPLVLVTGDIAYYHDMNGLLAVARANVGATIVCLNNDGGGIFHLLPIETHETFEEWFRTPHGLDFEHSATLYDLEFARTDDREQFRELYASSIESDRTQVIEFVTDSEQNHDERRRLEEAVSDYLGE